MALSFEWTIALKYLRAKRKQAFVSLITAMSTLGVILGVTALIVVLSVMSGFQNSLREKILGTNAHVIVLNYDGPFDRTETIEKRIAEVPGITATAPFVLSQVLLSSGERSTGVVLRGIDPARQEKVTGIAKHLRSGGLEGLHDLVDGRAGIIIGDELSRNLGAKTGDRIMVIMPLGQMTPMGLVPKMLEFRVTGVFKTGMFEYDSSLAYIDIRDAQKLQGIDGLVTGIEARVKDIFAADTVAQELQGRLGLPFKVRDWKEMNKNLFTAIRLEKTALFIILLLIVLVAAFNIITTLVMLVMEKNKDIAILKSMGATHASISSIFKLQGVIIGLLGTGIGGTLGVLLSLNLHPIVMLAERMTGIELLARDVYFIDRFPSQVDPVDVALVCLFSFLICYAATLYPARQAAKMDPAEVLRYE